MNNLAQQLQDTVYLLQNNIPFLLILMLGLWLIQFMNWLTRYRLNILGIYPRSWHGFIGIIFAPFLHGDFNHLFFNSLPLFILAALISIKGWPVFYCVSIIIIILAGFAVWLFGRRAIHIGASGLVMGYWSYLLVNAYTQPTISTVILIAVLLYYLGAGILLNLLPRERSSWESHVFGFAAGIAAAYLCPLLSGF